MKGRLINLLIIGSLARSLRDTVSTVQVVVLVVESLLSRCRFAQYINEVVRMIAKVYYSV